jgi:hypothetical protein
MRWPLNREITNKLEIFMKLCNIAAMRKLLFILAILALFIGHASVSFAEFSLPGIERTPTTEGLEEEGDEEDNEGFEEPLPIPEDLGKTDEEVEAGEDDEEEPAEKKEPTRRERAEEDDEEDVGEKEGRDKQFPLKLSMEAAITLNYKFLEYDDSFTINYNISLQGMIKQRIFVLRGNAKIATDVNGYLAKWATGECIPKVSIKDVPFEVSFIKKEESEATLKIKFKKAILEDWESLCTFFDAPGVTFNTKGEPEKWISSALEKTSPKLSQVVVAIDPDYPEETVTVPFTINSHTVMDEGMGQADIEGTGVITLEPLSQELDREESKLRIPAGLATRRR